MARVKRDRRAAWPQVAALQIEAMAFEVAKHLFDPHTTAIGSQGGALIRHVGG